MKKSVEDMSRAELAEFREQSTMSDDTSDLRSGGQLGKLLTQVVEMHEDTKALREQSEKNGANVTKILGSINNIERSMLNLSLELGKYVAREVEASEGRTNSRIDSLQNTVTSKMTAIDRFEQLVTAKLKALDQRIEALEAA